MDKELIEDRLYQIINQLNERLHLHYIYKGLFNLLNKVHPIYQGNGTTCRILFANDEIIYRQI